MSVFVNQGPWPWPPGRTQTGHTARRRRRRSFYDDGARRGRLARPTSPAPAPLGLSPAPALAAGPHPDRSRPTGASQAARNT